MNWYYVESGQQAGPVDDATLEQLRQSGRVQPDTLVWREGLANWMPLSEAIPGIAAGPGAASQAPGGADFSATPGTTTEAVCAECNGIFPIQDMVQFGNARVCARCKPIFMQKLAEGANVNVGQMEYAPLGTRFGAAVLDGLILWVVNTGISFAGGFGIGFAAGQNTNAALGLQLVLMAVSVGIGLSYETFFIGKFGATPGKMACKIKVVTAEGGRVTYARALGRYFAKMLNCFTCLIGYLIAFFDDQKRCLHDRICDTRVVVKS